MDIGQIFENNFDCYADTWSEHNGEMIEGDVVMAMTKKKFIEVVKNIAVLDSVSGCDEQWHTLSANMGQGKCSKCGKDLNDISYFR